MILHFNICQIKCTCFDSEATFFDCTVILCLMNLILHLDYQRNLLNFYLKSFTNMFLKFELYLWRYCSLQMNGSELPSANHFLWILLMVTGTTERVFVNEQVCIVKAGFNTSNLCRMIRFRKGVISNRLCSIAFKSWKRIISAVQST